MTVVKIQYRFSSKIWKYTGVGGWYFIPLPIKLSQEIRKTFRSEEAAWGRLTATARIGNSEWKTAIWFDTKANTYLLPVKSEIRKMEVLVTGKRVNMAVFI